MAIVSTENRGVLRWLASLETERTLRARLLRLIPSVALLITLLVGWELACRAFDVPVYLFPTPTSIVEAMGRSGSVIAGAFLVTLWESVLAFLISIIVGVVLAVILSSSRLLERATYPYVILLQTIPSVASAPLIIIWFGVTTTAVVIIAVIMAFVPVLSNTLTGLRSADIKLQELFLLLDATPAQSLMRLRLPFALPYFVTGLRVSSTLAVIGAIVGEYISGIGSGKAGLGFLITRSAIRLDIPQLFAAGLACAALGILFYQLVKWLSKLLLGQWHESEMGTNA